MLSFAEEYSIYAIILNVYMIEMQWNHIYTKTLLYQPV
jgi:hypothetical protein